MNGRVYDYNVGRFMSVDPLIHTEAGSQGINPYSYIFNNPLSGTDPTGYDAEQEKPKKETVTGSRIKGNSVAASGVAGAAGAMAKNSAAAGRAKTQAKIDAFAGALNSAINKQMGNGASSQTASSNTTSGNNSSGSGNTVDIGSTKEIASNKVGYSDQDGNEIPRPSELNGTETANISDDYNSYASSFDIADEDNDVTPNLKLNDNLEDRVFVTYIKFNPATGQVYVGRTSGFGDPLAVMRTRDLAHIRGGKLSGFSNAVLESAIRTGDRPRDYAVIRGREQQLINFFGGVEHRRVANKIRGVSKNNPFGRVMHQASSNAFGQISEFDGNF
jgi:hypothetical protein